MQMFNKFDLLKSWKKYNGIKKFINVSTCILYTK